MFSLPIDGSGRILTRIEAVLWHCILAALVIVAALAIAGVFTIALGYDEAWLLESAYQTTHRVAPELKSEPVLTSGGVYAAVQALVTGMTRHRIWASRIVSLGAVTVTALIVWRWATAGNCHRGRVLAIAGLASSPGIVFYGSTAFAEMPALMLLLMTSAAFSSSTEQSWRWRISVGLLGGLAAATRPNCVVIIPAFLCTYLLSPRVRRPSLLNVLLASGIALVVMATSVLIQSLCANSMPSVLRSAQGDAGLGRFIINYPFLMNKWLVMQKLAPLALLVLITVGVIRVFKRNQMQTGVLPAWLLLLPFSWLAWLAWLTNAPIAHLRYLWPALPAFWIMAGLVLSDSYESALGSNRLAVRVSAMAIGLAATLGNLGSSVREVVHGDGDVLPFEWSGESPLTSFTRFRNIGYQRAATRFLHDFANPDERVLAIGLGRAIGLLADRIVVSTGEADYRPEIWPFPRARHVFTAVLSTQYLSESALLWLRNNCRREATFGPYTFYTVTGDYPSDLRVLIPSEFPYPEKRVAVKPQLPDFASSADRMNEATIHH